MTHFNIQLGDHNYALALELLKRAQEIGDIPKDYEFLTGISIAVEPKEKQ